MRFFTSASKSLRKLCLSLAKPDILFYSLPWLIFLVIAGTVSQKQLGLYGATTKYFSSIILWLGPIPTPGGLTTIGLIFIALSIKFIFFSPWNRKKAGIVITHLGILLLLLGGIITSAVSYNGFMVIPEGRNVGEISDYYKKVLQLKTKEGVLQSHAFNVLQKNSLIKTTDLTIEVLEKCENCGARAPTGLYKNLQGLAQNMELHPLPLEKQKEANFSGLVLKIIDKNNKEESGTYMVMEDIPKNPIFKTKEGEIEIILERQTKPIPFSLTLKDFRKINYPGTKKAKEFESDLIVHDGALSWPVTISMNKPLRYKGYTFYQSSFEQRPNIEVTVLSVVQNKGRAFPYIATLVIFLGLLLHLIIHLQGRKKRRRQGMFKIFTLMLILVLLPFPSLAQENINLKGWSQLPILHEGRLKPMDSFARIHLKKFSKKETLDGKTASEWLAQTLFTPDEAALIPVFKIRNFENYELPKKKNKLYSYVEIAPRIHKQKDVINTLLEMDSKKWTPEQKDLIELYKNISLYVQILRSLTGILPLNIKSEESQSYLSLKNSKNIKALSTVMTVIKEGGKNNIYLRPIPQDWEEHNGEWLSIWNTINAGHIKKDTLSYLKNWQDLADAYRDSNQEQWDKALSETPSALSTTRLKTEQFYNIMKLLTIAGLLYFLSFSLTTASNLFSPKKLARLSFFFLTLGAVANGLDIILRIYILNRAPVGTLYESIIFVSFICVIGFLSIEQKYKNQTGLLLGSITGIILLITAKSFAGDDTMNTLVAVLNTNFWLLTHVICITIGYAICFLTAMIAHYYLVLKIWHAEKNDFLKQLSKAIKTLIIVALLFTSIGTILGGIWADQSWGRFWGWDPKENGALLIVLWIVWLLHGRISKHINETGFIIGSALLSVIVVIAWFGVNLLSVGLHSYGFISGIALSIALFCIVEFLFIGSLWFLGRLNREKQA